jgi:hypothetical protein
VEVLDSKLDQGDMGMAFAGFPSRLHPLRRAVSMEPHLTSYDMVWSGVDDAI